MHSILMLFVSIIICTLSKGEEEGFVDTSYSKRYSGISPRVIGGEDAREGEFPFIVSIQKQDASGTYRHYCGGVILNSRLIITAAHCTRRDLDKALVVAGTTYLDRHDGAQVVGISSFTDHPRFNYTISANDISILVIGPPLKFNKNVQPVKLPPQGREPTGKCLLVGWGATRTDVYEPGALPNTLQKVELTITERHHCPISIKAVDPYNIKIFDSGKFCSHELDKGSHPGDSGSAVMCKDQDQNLYLAGTSSWGIYFCPKPGCSSSTDFVSVFTHVGYFHCYIRQYLLNHPDSKKIRGYDPASVKTRKNPPLKKISCSYNMNKTHHISTTQQLKACKDYGDECDPKVQGDCCSGYCRLSIGRGVVCTLDKEDDPLSNPSGYRFSMNNFFIDKFLSYKGWIGAGCWYYDTNYFFTLNDAGKAVELKELPAVRDFIFDTETCCVEGMIILITDGLDNSKNRLKAWDIVNYWREELISNGR